MMPEIKDRMIAIAGHCFCRRLNFKGLLLTWLFTKNSSLLSSSTILLLDLAGRLCFIIDGLAAGRQQHVPPTAGCELTGSNIARQTSHEKRKKKESAVPVVRLISIDHP
jgi:hypothetical protein